VKSLADVIKVYQRACSILINCEKTSTFLFTFFVRMGFPKAEISRGTFAIARAASKCEKAFFREELSGLDRRQFIACVKGWATTVNRVNPMVMDIRKLHLLTKWRPEWRDEIMREVKIPRERAMTLSNGSAEIRKYATRIFNISPDKLKLDEGTT
jgi:hypothetical protein